jgi:hypothetical protein
VVMREVGKAVRVGLCMIPLIQVVGHLCVPMLGGYLVMGGYSSQMQKSSIMAQEVATLRLSTVH